MVMDKKTPDYMTDMEKYFRVFFNELEILTTELQSLDDLYKEMKTAINDAKEISKNNRRTGASPFVFLFNMYSNLNANRANKLSLIRDLSKLKKTIADLTFREDHGDEMEEKFKALAGSLYKQIRASEDRNSGIEEEIIETGEDLEAIARIAYKKETGEDYSGLAETIIYVCDEEEGRIFVVNDLEELEILDEIDEEDIPSMFDIEWKTDGLVRRCLDLSSGTNIPVIQFDSE